MIVLLTGAEVMVRGASRLAASIGISPLVVGLTIVAFGTSAPELAIGLSAIFKGTPDVGVGNVVGSNISNVLLILGASAAMLPLVISQRVIRLDVPLMIGFSILTFILAIDGRLSWIDGLILVVTGAAYFVFTVRASRKEPKAVRDEYEKEFGSQLGDQNKRLLYMAMIAAGLALLVLGSNWLVSGAVALARLVGLSELVIGLTVVAVGTSMPELITSIVASLKGERDIAVGNVIGSNIMNLVIVLGVTSLVARGGLPVAQGAIHFDFPVMLASAVACLPIFYTDQKISRWEGTLFLVYYVAYIAYLVLNATQHDAAPAFGVIMLTFVVPLTVLTLGILTFRHFVVRRRVES